MSISIEIAIILVLILGNGVFAGSEIAVVSARKSRLQQRAGSDPRARRALELANDPNRFLSTVQIGITLVGVFAGAFGGATIAQELAARFAEVPWLARSAQPLALIIVVAAITFTTLIIGELVPKRIALMHPERIAARIAGPMHTLSRLATPLVTLLGAATNLVLRLLPVRESAEPAVTEEDVRLLLEQGTRAGVFLAAEQDIVENVFWLGDQRVDSVMTPRHRIVWLDVNASTETHIRVMVANPQARYILCDGHLDNVTGVVSMKDVWPALLQGRPLDIATPAGTPLFVPESTRALTLLEQFRMTSVHVALVVDEFSNVQGLTTLTDILEGLVGELQELAEDDVVQREDGSWLVGASVRIADVRDLLGLPGQAWEGEPEYRTLGGLVLHTLGRVPAAADYFLWEGFRIEVVDMDGKRVDKVLIQQADSTGSAAPRSGES
jgi:putative hemolysin